MMKEKLGMLKLNYLLTLDKNMDQIGWVASCPSYGRKLLAHLALFLRIS